MLKGNHHVLIINFPPLLSPSPFFLFYNPQTRLQNCKKKEKLGRKVSLLPRDKATLFLLLLRHLLADFFKGFLYLLCNNCH